MMGDPRSHGLWEASAPAAPATSALTGHIDVDVAIIGGGYTGTSAALHLAQEGAQVALLEAVDIGFGGSGRNVGLVNAGMWVMPSVIKRELGPERGMKLLQLLGQAPAVVFDLVQRHGMACEAWHHGTLHCAVGAKGAAEVAERASEWRALGANVELLDADQTQHMTGSRAYSAALLDHRAGTIQPLAYARGLAAAAIGAGAQLFTRSLVIAARQDGARWHLSAGHGGSVSAAWVIVATNAYTGAASPWPAIQDELVQMPYFNLATAPLPEALAATILPGRQGAWDTRQVLSSMRFDAAGRLVFGSIGALRGLGRQVHRDWGRRAMTQLFPQLKGVDFEHEWYGTIGMTNNALPRFHQLAPNVVSFSGYNGRGIAPGTVLGRELARLVLGQVRSEDLALPVTPVQPAAWRAAKQWGYDVGSQVFHAVDARW